jgi:hypothetical protein
MKENIYATHYNDQNRTNKAIAKCSFLANIEIRDKLN